MCRYRRLIFLAFFIQVSISFGQKAVGIGTQTPRANLEVAGDVIISSSMDLLHKASLTASDSSTFLVQDNQNKIKALDVSNPKGAALGYIQEYIIQNPNGDWVRDFDTKVNATDFVMISISAFYDREIAISGNSSTKSNGSAPYTAAFIQNGTWHLIADFPAVSNINNSEIGTWNFTTLIYSKDLIKQLGTVTIPMGGDSIKVATSPIIN